MIAVGNRIGVGYGILEYDKGYWSMIKYRSRILDYSRIKEE